MTFKCRQALAFSLLFALCPLAFAQADSADNGTDPTKNSSSAAAQIEHLDLGNGLSSQSMKFTLGLKVGEQGQYGLKFKAPVARVNGIGKDGYAQGDLSVALSNVFGLTREHGFVAMGELVLDTADRSDLGTGKNVVKGTLVYAMFLAGGDIFAPAWVQSASLNGDSARAPVNSSTLDFYYVPKLATPGLFITVDPAVTLDWEKSRQFVSLATTFGKSLGPALGGQAQMFIKPSVYGGNERPADWGLEVGMKLIGF